MADVITRLKVESTEHDRKLKNAVATLRELAQTYEKDTQAGQEFAGSLGMMATKAQSASGRANELRSSFKELSSVYSELTDKEKKSPFGKELAQSMETLKARYKETQGVMKDADKALGENQKSTKGLGSELLGLGKQLGLIGGALGTAKGALGVLKDAFMSSESNVDAWGRTVKAAGSVYNGFLNALNSGDISGYLSNIDTIVTQAKKAYDALDKLQTYNTFRSPERVKLEGQLTQQKKILRDKNSTQAQKNEAAANIKRIEGQIRGTYKDEEKQNYNYVLEETKNVLAQAGIPLTPRNIQVAMRSLQSTEGYEALQRGAKGKKRIEQFNLTKGGVGYRTVDDRNSNQKILDALTDEKRRELSPFLVASYQSRYAADKVELQDMRYTNSAGGSGGGRGGSVYTPKTQALKMDAMSGLGIMSELDHWREQRNRDAEVLLAAGKDEMDLARMRTGNEYGLGGKFKRLDTPLEKLSFGKHEFTKEEKTALRVEKLQTQMSKVSDGLSAGSALVGGIGDLITQLGGNSDALKGVMTAISMVQTVIGIVTAAIQLNTMMHAKPFASGGVISAANGWGGVVGGGSFAGDMVPIRANSGEVVFNQTDAGKLYDYIHNNSVLGGGQNQLRLSTEVSGSNLRIVLNNDGRRRGRGSVIG